MADQIKPKVRSAEASLLKPLLDPESSQESDDSAFDDAERRFHDERPPHHEAR